MFCTNEYQSYKALGQEKRDLKTSMKIVRDFIRTRPIKFNPSINELDIFNNFCVCTYVFSITLILVNMFVYNVNKFVNISNVLYICQ